MTAKECLASVFNTPVDLLQLSAVCRISDAIKAVSDVKELWELWTLNARDDMQISFHEFSTISKFVLSHPVQSDGGWVDVKKCFDCNNAECICDVAQFDINLKLQKMTDEEIIKIDFYDLCGMGSIGMTDEEKIIYWRKYIDKTLQPLPSTHEDGK